MATTVTLISSASLASGKNSHGVTQTYLRGSVSYSYYRDGKDMVYTITSTVKLESGWKYPSAVTGKATVNGVTQTWQAKPATSEYTTSGTWTGSTTFRVATRDTAGVTASVSGVGSWSGTFVVEPPDTPPIKVKAGGAWKETTAAYVKVNGAWKEITAAYVKVNGSWKEPN